MRKQAGIALVSALIFMVIVVILLSIATTSALNNRRNASDVLRTSQAQFTAEAGLEAALVKVWHEIRWSEAWVRAPKETQNMTTYSSMLDAIGLAVGRSISANRVMPDGSRYDYVVRREGNKSDAGGNLQAIFLEVTSTGTLPDGQTTRVLRQKMEIRRDFFPFDFAILTNNAECTFCHLEIKSLEAMKGNPTPSDSSTWWPRAKVGVLESLIMRTGDDGGIIHGSVLSRGIIRREDDTAVETQLKTTFVPGTSDGRIKDVSPTAQVRPTKVDCRSAPADCRIKQNFYLNYPTDSELGPFGGKPPDGLLPEDFPLPISDSNGNRKIDDNEWNSTLSSSIAGQSDDYPRGSLKAVATLGPDPNNLSWPSGPASTFSTNDQLRALGLTQQDVILDGANTPIEVSGTVFINGDLIIRGKVRGNGTIIARGNVYVLGDLTYDCASLGCDYKYPNGKPDASPPVPPLPKLSLISVGNTLVGDYLTVDTWRNTSIDLLDLNPKYIQGTLTFCKSGNNASSDSCSHIREDEDPPTRLIRPNLTLTEIANYNQSELVKALRALRANQPYIPRFYTYGEDVIYFSTSPPGSGNNQKCERIPRRYDDFYSTISAGAIVYDCSTVTTPGAEPVALTLTQAEVDWLLNPLNHAKYEVNPTRIAPGEIKKLWVQSVTGRFVGREGSLRTDGLLYSANAIFSIAHPDNNGAATSGKWDLRGSVVAPDLGILAPNGLTIYHDSRIRPRIYQEQALQVFRYEWQVIKK